MLRQRLTRITHVNTGVVWWQDARATPPLTATAAAGRRPPSRTATVQVGCLLLHVHRCTTEHTSGCVLCQKRITVSPRTPPNHDVDVDVDVGAESPLPRCRNVALPSSVVVLVRRRRHRQATKLYLDALLPPVLHCLDDAESRVRYYACESLYNIAKVCSP